MLTRLRRGPSLSSTVHRRPAIAIDVPRMGTAFIVASTRPATALEVSASTVARVLRRCGLSRRGPAYAAADRPALRARGGRRSAAPGFQEAGPHSRPGAPHDRAALPPLQRRWLGVLARRRRRSPRVAYVELLPAEGRATARGFLRGALRWFRAHGVPVRRTPTDNGSAYRSRGFRAACRALHVSHRRTRPYTPRTNGKAERFIQTALREWAYRRPYYTSADRGGSPGLVGALQLRATAHEPQPAAPHESRPAGEQPHARSHLAHEERPPGILTDSLADVP